MGMFDSLYIELDGREQEIQTKRFDCVLGHYHLGDWIDGSPPGVRVYFDSLWLDATGRRVYRADAECSRKTTLLIVLVQGVFVDYRIHEGELATEAIEPILRELRECWSDYPGSSGMPAHHRPAGRLPTEGGHRGYGGLSRTAA